MWREKVMIAEIRSKLKNKCSKDMIVHRDDPEYCKGMSNAQKQHVEIQARHVLKEFETSDRHYELKKYLTWRHCCSFACKELLSSCFGRTVEFC